MNISIVIPTYNRPEQLVDVLRHILRSDVDGFHSVEIIVVDDGSHEPACPIVESVKVSAPFSLRCIRQENAGPAEARNNGFRNSRHETVLFIDDDILVFPDLIRRHAEAHIEMPHSVICGQSPYVPPERVDPEYSYLNGLIAEGFESIGAGRESKFVKIEIVASGNISVEKSIFNLRDVYAPGLTIPVGEEYELSAYLSSVDVPIYFFPEIKGWHLQPATIIDSSKQNYKYGAGIAELAMKRPDVLSLEQPRHIWEINRGIVSSDPVQLKLKKKTRALISSAALRPLLLWFAVKGKSVLPRGLLFPLYRLVIGSFFSAGIREGIKRFGGGKD